MGSSNQKPHSSKFSVLFKLSIQNEFSIDKAENIAQDWLAKHPGTSWNDLLELLETYQVVYKQGALYELSQFTRAGINLVINRMRGINGIEIKNRWYHTRLYRKCFIGSEVIEWLTSNFKLSRKEALELGQILIRAKIIHHVHDEHDFKDDYLFYRFYVDE